MQQFRIFSGQHTRKKGSDVFPVEQCLRWLSLVYQVQSPVCWLIAGCDKTWPGLAAIRAASFISRGWFRVINHYFLYKSSSDGTVGSEAAQFGDFVCIPINLHITTLQGSRAETATIIISHHDTPTLFRHSLLCFFEHCFYYTQTKTFAIFSMSTFPESV